MKCCYFASGALALCVFAGSAGGSLIFEEPVSMKGGGDAGVRLKVELPAGTVNEWVYPTFGCALLDSGIGSAEDLRILLRPAGRGGEGVTVDSLVLAILSPEGTRLYTSGPFMTVVIPTTRGEGPTGFLFRLDEAELAVVPEAVFSDPYNRISLSVSIRGAKGRTKLYAGPEEAFGPDPPAETPEPGSWFLVGAGVGVIILRRWRVRRGVGWIQTD